MNIIERAQAALARRNQPPANQLPAHKPLIVTLERRKSKPTHHDHTTR